MRKLFVHSDRVLVGHVASVLQSHGIDVMVRNDVLGAAAGELPVNETWPEVWVVSDDDYTQAERLLSEVIAPEPVETSAQPWTCPRCAETIEPQFSECWLCAADASGTLQA